TYSFCLFDVVLSYSYLFFIMKPQPPKYTLFPYTTLFRSPNSEVTQFIYKYNLNDRKFINNQIESNVDLIYEGINPQNIDLDLMEDRKSTRLNSSHVSISYAVFCLKKKKT